MMHLVVPCFVAPWADGSVGNLASQPRSNDPITITNQGTPRMTPPACAHVQSGGMNGRGTLMRWNRLFCRCLSVGGFEGEGKEREKLKEGKRKKEKREEKKRKEGKKPRKTVDDRQMWKSVEDGEETSAKA